jgi:hypothetical protein
MSERPEPRMPQDWNDHLGWYLYFQGRLARDPVWEPWDGVFRGDRR